MTPRPNLYSDEVWAKADADLRKALEGVEALNGFDLEEVMQSIRHCSAFDFDGHKLACRLEDDLGCDCTLQDAEDLDGLDGILHRAHEDLVKEWVKAEGVVSLFQVGDRVRFRHFRQDMEGIVEKINAEMAKVVVKAEGENGKPIINFEDATKVEVQAK